MLMTRSSCSLVEASDGIFLFTPESYEPYAVAAVRRWFRETGRPVYTTGPLLPDASKSEGAAADHEKTLSKEGAEIQQFLDDTLKSSGEKSLVYVSNLSSCCDRRRLTRPCILALEIDLVWVVVLACQESREGLGCFGCCYRTEHSLRKSRVF